MPSPTLIKQIDVVVYPFFAKGYELVSPSGKQKYDLWMRNMHDALVKKDTAFFILQDNSFPLTFKKMQPKVAEYYIKFLKLVKKLAGSNLAFVSYSNLPNSVNLGFKRFSSLGFDPKVKIRYYGQHVSLPRGVSGDGACVENSGVGVARKLKGKLIKSGVSVVLEKSNRLSVKSWNDYATNLHWHGVKQFAFPAGGEHSNLLWPPELLHAILIGEKKVFSLRPNNRVSLRSMVRNKRL